jgi:hypothetical protein
MAKTNTPDAEKVEIRFNGQPHHELVADGITILGGKTGRVSRETADRLVGADWTDVTFADASEPAWPRGHSEIDELAKKLDVELPTVPAAGGAKKPTVADKIAALESAGFTPATALAAAESTTSEDAPAS